jgi:hypothetical protein
MMEAAGSGDPGGDGGGGSVAGDPPRAAALLRALWGLADQADRWLCFQPPAMDASWHPDYARRLVAALDAGGPAAGIINSQEHCSTAESSPGQAPMPHPPPCDAARPTFVHAPYCMHFHSALSAGGDPGDAFAALQRAAAELPGGVPWPLLRRCVAAGLHPDADIGGGTPLLLYLLARPFPPPLDGGEAGSSGEAEPAARGRGAPGPGADAGGEEEEEEQCPVSLQRLLAAGATPNLPGPKGLTALHLVVGCLAERTHFPPFNEDLAYSSSGSGKCTPNTSATGGGCSGEVGGAEAGGNGVAVMGEDAEARRWRDGRAFLAQASADGRRAAYARAAFAALLAAGWSPGTRGGRGGSAADCVAAAAAAVRAELGEFMDPRSLPRAALAEFVAAEGGAAERLQELVRAHERGVAAVAAALDAMGGAAAAARGPRAVRAAAVLLALWALLLAAGWHWLVAARRLAGLG